MTGERDPTRKHDDDNSTTKNQWTTALSNGFTRVPNKILRDWLPQLTPAEFVIAIAIWGETEGWHRIDVVLTTDQLVALTAMSQPTITDAVNRLIGRGILDRRREPTERGAPFRYRLVPRDKILPLKKRKKSPHQKQLKDDVGPLCKTRFTNGGPTKDSLEVVTKDSLEVVTKDSLVVTTKDSLVVTGSPYIDKERSRSKKTTSQYDAKKSAHYQTRLIPDPTPDSPKKQARPNAQTGTRIDPHFLVEKPMAEWAQKTAPHVNVEFATAEFIDFWISVPGARGRKLDWIATWRNRMRELEDRALRDERRRNGYQQPKTRAEQTDEATRIVMQEIIERHKHKGDKK